MVISLVETNRSENQKLQVYKEGDRYQLGTHSNHDDFGPHLCTTLWARCCYANKSPEDCYSRALTASRQRLAQSAARPATNMQSGTHEW